MHLICFYNLAGRDQGIIRTNKNRYLEKVLSRATGLSDQPVLICMDANSSIQASHCLTLATNSGKWIDLGAHYTNNQPAPTFGASKDWGRVTWGPNVSRPDYMFGNPALLCLCETFKIRRDLSPKGHLGLELVLKVDVPCMPYRALQSPKAFPAKVSTSAEQQQQVLDQVLSKWLDKFETVKYDSDLAWQTFSALSEDYLRGIHKCSKHREGGRRTKIRFRQMNCTQAAADKNILVKSAQRS